MNDRKAPVTVIDAIYQRRSVRSYRDIPVHRESILKLLEAAVRAPTAIHQECWTFVVVQDPDRLRRVSERARKLFLEEVYRGHLDRGGHALEVFEKPDFNIFYNAGTLIVICAPSTGLFMEADCWLAAENLMLMAHAMGLGTCVIGSATIGLNTPDIKSELGIPDDYFVVAPIIVGVPGDTGQVTERRAPRILSWL